jgi:hypothetical protein
MLEELGGPVLIAIGALFLVALIGLASACVYQYRQWRRRKIMRGDR